MGNFSRTIKIINENQMENLELRSIKLIMKIHRTTLIVKCRQQIKGSVDLKINQNILLNLQRVNVRNPDKKSVME